MTQLNHVSQNNTVVYYDGDHVVIKLHYTEVVKFNHTEIILNSGCYETATTKTRMNQASNQYGLGFKVYQEDFIWYVKYRDFIVEFEDGMKLDRTGLLMGSLYRGALIDDDIVISIESWNEDFKDSELDSIIEDYWNEPEYKSEILNEEIYSRMNELAPTGFYFGYHPGNGSDIGFWLCDFDTAHSW
jgi:hypothetical protein